MTDDRWERGDVGVAAVVVGVLWESDNTTITAGKTRDGSVGGWAKKTNSWVSL